MPGVPEYVATGSLSYKWWQFIFRLSSRYQSQVWRDSDNTIAVPGSTIFDTTVDFDGKKFKRFPVAIGFGVYNVTDERRLPIQAYETRANQGYTAYSDYGGMPLPGRQWRLSLSALF